MYVGGESTITESLIALSHSEPFLRVAQFLQLSIYQGQYTIACAPAFEDSGFISWKPLRIPCHELEQGPRRSGDPSWQLYSRLNTAELDNGCRTGHLPAFGKSRADNADQAMLTGGFVTFREDDRSRRVRLPSIQTPKTDLRVHMHHADVRFCILAYMLIGSRRFIEVPFGRRISPIMSVWSIARHTARDLNVLNVAHIRMIAVFVPDVCGPADRSEPRISHCSVCRVVRI